MDPNATWQRILRIQEEMLYGDYSNELEFDELYADLNEWIEKGGFAPEGWPF